MRYATGCGASLSRLSSCGSPTARITHYEVRHPELLALARTHLVLVDPVTDRTEFIALMRVNSIGALQTA